MIIQISRTAVAVLRDSTSPYRCIYGLQWPRPGSGCVDWAPEATSSRFIKPTGSVYVTLEMGVIVSFEAQ